MTETVKGKLKAAAERLKKHHQDHLLRFAEELTADQKTLLLEDISRLDFDLIDPLIEQYVRQEPRLDLPKEILPAPVYPMTPGPDLQKKYQQARNKGAELIRAGKLAAFTVAGGQGTRLNFDGPKGNITATPVRNKSLFRVFAEGIMAVQNRYDCIVPWYIMTSPANHEQTLETFQQKNYFGLDPAHVSLFPQGMMPSFAPDGKILLSDKHRLALSPDGHGGSLRALHASGALANMAQRGVEYISYFQVDNPLVYTVDPLFIGLHVLDGAEMSSKAVKKAAALEKVGNFTLTQGKVQVIEYSDLPDELAQKKLDNGRLAFEFGSIAIHIINRCFVEKLNQHGFSLPWHRAVKRVPCLDNQGQRTEPDAPNAVKLETFVFDALPLASASIVLEVDRSEQFAPIKNASGVDSLESSQQLQINRAARWLEAAGIDVPRRPDGSVDAMIELSLLFALDPEELARQKKQIRPVKPGDIIYLG